MMYDPKDWYWEAADGRVFASARVAVVDDTDAGFAAWRADGNEATPWPRDGAGEQTVVALQQVLTPHGLFADLRAYAEMKRWEAEVGGIVVAGVPISTDDRSKQMLMGARIAAQANPAFSTPWVAADGVVATLGAVEVIAVSDAVLAHVQGCFETFALVVDDIAMGAITTTAAIDAAFA